ncbi:ABC transporter substrate-binding protein [Campylobacter sp. MIT 99-7217]|uniref:MetQ/NlpA family ABC transporter substrate-binding protein n=1 Tax=Campylobacter sp. MIT 99-7217 TaxID=535091 RepID=UPI00115855FF|nr:MetQ/NlpA family ABC transporter substrate-binding protein [Campylobacter sp. MIT 99-7217]TQR29515.1 ABC transporter substrate-binding protein [Campylobacter sp. MIT 99-7217]
MSKFLKILFLSLSLSLGLKAEELIKIGAVPTPHAEILRFIAPLLQKEGFRLEIFEFTDGIRPNISTDEGDLDANFFQHKPYLDEFNKSNKTNLVSVAKIHIEPMGVYSNKHKGEFKPAKNSSFALPNNPTNESRALQILEQAGLIKLKKSELATTLDIIENPLNLRFIEIKDAQLIRSLSDVDYAVINGNFAIMAGLKPTKDALFLESKYSLYANILVVKRGKEQSVKTKALIKALTSKEAKEYINSNFDGGVIPVF